MKAEQCSEIEFTFSCKSGQCAVDLEVRRVKAGGRDRREKVGLRKNFRFLDF
jgi:hypothetical protein